jgi:hypothetical protein
MNHLTMEQLLELREPGLEPGLATAREHLDGCAECQAEAERLGQRINRLRALPQPRPSRDQFLEIRSRHVKERRRHTLFGGLQAGFALAAGIALVVLVRPAANPPGNSLNLAGNGEIEATPAGELDAMRARSQALEETLRRYDPDRRAIDGRTAAIAARIEDQLSALDRQIELLNLMDRADPMRDTRQLRLWRERVGLLDALVDVHVTRASYAGL